MSGAFLHGLRMALASRQRIELVSPTERNLKATADAAQRLELAVYGLPVAHVAQRTPTLQGVPAPELP